MSDRIINMTLPLNDTMHRALQKRAKLEGQTLSAMIRSILARNLEKELQEVTQEKTSSKRK